MRLILSILLILGIALLPAIFPPKRPGFIILQVVLVAAAVTIVLRWLLVWPLKGLTEWIKNIRLGHTGRNPIPFPYSFFEPLVREVRAIAESLLEAREAAEKEAKLRHSAESLWTAERLKEHVRSKLQRRPLIVASNREPYTHVRQGRGVECVIPASGLVTALEPILRACGGLWIAQGTGDADREMVDGNDKLGVPPEDPQYTLRRVWVSEAEERGYYYGFANEGLWPLCHIAHTRPLFRPEDWAAYLAVNERFAQVVLAEIEGTEEPCVLVQDYHFALLPQMIKDKRPDARVAMFWHIPWPNSESFGICPWRRELLQGMLGADLLGFHIQFHCNNFLDTVDQTLESRIDRERFVVNRQGHTTRVLPFPISVAFTSLPAQSLSSTTAPMSREVFFKQLGIKSRYLGVGVDRLDYTKGIVERFRAIEKFLEQNTTYVGEFTYVELAAPSRTLIPRYKELEGEIEREVERINARFKTADWVPLVLLKKQHSHKEIEPFYKFANVCLVTSLHDGMNLVAKEFVAARDDEDGVLILSPFTGASRELRDALIANPYDVEQMAQAIVRALEMSDQERSTRMRRMRSEVRDHNIYRWGANLISELTQIRLPVLPPPPSVELAFVGAKVSSDPQ